MPFVAYSQNYMLTQLTTNHGGYLSLHSAYSTTGTNELTGGSPAYARVVPTWAAASGGAIATSSIASSLNVPASSTVAFIGMWDALTSGNFQGMGANGGAAQYAFTVTLASPGVLTAPGSSYSNGNTVVLWSGAGDTVPAAYTVGTIYYVVSASGTTFSLAATSGGSAINTAAAGAGLVQAITVETYGAQGTFTISSDTLTLF
jgi:hypothetical protein